MDRSRQELRELDAAIGGLRDEPDAPFGVKIMRDGLVRKRQMVMAQAAGEFELVLSGEEAGVVGDEISLVGRVLNSLQESIASIAQVLEGEPTSRGLIPGATKESVSLKLLTTAPGSLKMTLVPAHPELDSPEATQMRLEGDDENEEEAAPLVDRSVDRLLGLLSYEPGDTDLLQDLADVGPRTVTHLEELTRALDEGGAGASFGWRSCYVSRSLVFSRPASKALRQKLKEVDEDSREIVVTGRLVGGSLVHRRFELEPSNEHQGLIAGVVADSALPSIELLFGKNCTATLDVNEARLPSGETRESHFLKSLSEQS
jgi:hypothetical protein